MKLLLDYVREAEASKIKDYYIYLLLKSKGLKVTYVGETDDEET